VHPNDQYLDFNNFSVSLDFFSGPMDLLLHLVEHQEVDIENVNLSLVCDQYLKIVSQSAELDLDRASEFLVVAATLAARKSEALLPSAVPVESITSDEQFDPRFFSELRDRLKAYKLAKIRSEALISAPQLGIDVFAPRRMQLELEDDSCPEIRGDGLQIGRLFFKMLKRIGEAATGFRIRLEPVTVVKYMVSVVDRLSAMGGSALKFLDIVGGIDEIGSSRAKITGAFIATLELAKRGIVTVTQQGELISLSYVGVQEGVKLASEFDQDAQSPEVGNDKIIDLAAYRKSDVLPVAVDHALKEANSGS